DWFAGLDDATRAAIEAAAVDSADWYRTYTEETQAALLAELEKEGAVVTRPDIAAFIERAASANYDAALQPIIEKVRGVGEAVVPAAPSGAAFPAAFASHGLPMSTILARLGDVLRAALSVIVAAALFLIVVLVFYQVITRYFTGTA